MPPLAAGRLLGASVGYATVVLPDDAAAAEETIRFGSIRPVGGGRVGGRFRRQVVSPSSIPWIPCGTGQECGQRQYAAIDEQVDLFIS